jgi:hypothetical protein
MTAPTEPELAALLADLDRESFAAFLAALWTARGRPADVEDGDVAVADGTTLRPHAPRSRLPARLAARGVEPGAADVVVTTDRDVAALLRERGVDVVGPAALHRALLYDLDRATADRIAREHLGRSFDAEPTPPLGRRARQAADRLVPAVLAVAVLVAAGAAVLVVVTADVPNAGGPPPTAEPVTDEPTDDSVGWVEEDEVDGVGAYTVAPGVSTEGVTNGTALARAHADAVRNRSYEWGVIYRRSSGGENPVLGDGSGMEARQLARVENGSESLVRVSGSTAPDESTILGTNRDVYTDGTTRYVRRYHANGTATVRRMPAAGNDSPRGLAAQSAALVGWIRDAQETDVVEAERRDGVVTYRLVGRGSGASTYDYRLEARLTSSGFVTDLEVSYIWYGERGSTFLEFDYRRVGATTVERPAWVAEKTTNGTMNGTATAAPATPAG